MIGFVAGVVYNNAWEWVIHKHLLHGLGRSRESQWSFHWHEHHKSARRHGMRDENYRRSVFGWHGQGKEALGLLAAALVHAPLVKRFPWFTAGVWCSQLAYYVVHKRSHRDPAWARRWVPWHFDHHMGPNQHANWGVTWPLWDHVMGTREPYAGTDRDRADQARAAARAQPAARAESSATAAA